MREGKRCSRRARAGSQLNGKTLVTLESRLRRSKATLIALLVLTMTYAANAAFEWPCTVQQPVLTRDGGPALAPVTYVCFGDLWASPGWIVSMTFGENRIRAGSQFQDRNAAHLAGFKFSTVRRELPLAGQAHGLFGDTLRVIVDVSASVDPAFRADSLLMGFPVADVLDATLAAMKANAALEYPRFQFLDVRVVGDSLLSEKSVVIGVDPPAH